MVSRRSLAVALSKLQVFKSPKVKLEQYPTESDLAAELLWHAHLRGELSGKRVIDLGAGTGILAIGAALLGAEVTAVEKDAKAIEILRENVRCYEGTDNIVIIQSDIADFSEAGDLVIMNPPFGTKERHADRCFLEKARGLAPVIYTIHKATTKKFITAFCRDNDLRIEWQADRDFPLRQTMSHHQKRRERVAVTLYRLEKSHDLVTRTL